MAKHTIAVLGPGGVGGLVAGLAARSGHRVIVLAGGATAESLRAGGISVTSAHLGDFTAEVEVAEALVEPVDLCIVAVKQTSLSAALDRVPADVVKGGLVLPLLNGVEHVALLRDRFSSDSVAAGVIRVESTRTAAGQIVHGSPFIQIDVASQTAPQAQLSDAGEVLSECGITTRVLDDETAMLWGKLSVLAPFALLTTHYDATIGEVRTTRRAELVRLVDEVAAIGFAAGGPDITESAMTFYDSFPYGACSSMQRDASAGLPLEIDAIGGAVLRAAQRQGIPAPITQELVASLA